MKQLHSGVRIICGMSFVAERLEHGHHQFTHRRVVFDDEYSIGGSIE